MRKALRSGPPMAQTSQNKTFPAPRRGWIRNESLAKPGPEGASILDNWFPTTTGARVRRGSIRYATIGSGQRVAAIMAYVNGDNRKLFAGNEAAIYDITTPADPDVSPAAAVSGLVASDYAYTMFANAGGTYLVVVNGHDERQLFDGTAWTAPAITGPTNPKSHVWTFKQRQFFVEKDTTNAWYLDTDAIQGAATILPLGGVFKLGGSLLFGATWSYDAGSGLAESCVFVTTEGEVAVYEGTDPSSADTWALKGVYRVGRPLGKRGVMKGGGDLAIATDIGLVPLSQAISMDAAAVGGKSVSYAIEEEWNKAVAERSGVFSWQVELWPTQQMAMVCMPAFASSPKICFVVNVRTGAWARYTNWDVQCLGLLVDRMFFGTADGHIVEAEKGGSDEGRIYTAAMIGLFDDLGAPAAKKTVSMARATLLSTAATGSKVSIATEFGIELTSAPSVSPAPSGSNNWDEGVWNQALWGDTISQTREAVWKSVSGVGYAVAPVLQISIGGLVEPQIDLVEIDIVFQRMAIVT